MTGFQNRAILALVPALVLVLSVRAGPACAQDASGSAIAASPGPEAPVDTSGAAAATDATTFPAPPGVVVNTLGDIDGPAAGLLDDTNGGLGTQMWSGAARADLEDELARIPVVTTDPVVRALARRILLTTSETPVGPAKRPLIAIRLERLLDAGFIADAGALAAKADLPNNNEFARAQAEALLYAQRDGDICSDRTRTRLSNPDPFWLQLRAYCYAAGGDAAAADLTRAVMTAQGINDPILDATLAGDAKAVLAADVTRPTAVDVYLLRKAGGHVSAEFAAPLGTPANLLAARDAHNPPADRLAAAERISSTGALNADDLRAIADAQVQTVTGDTAYLAQQVALRGRTAKDNPDEKLALAAQANAMGAPFPVFAALQSDSIASVPAMPGSNYALLAAKILMSEGKSDAAEAWIGALVSPETAQANLALDLISPIPERDARAKAAVDWILAHATPETGSPAAAALMLGIWNAFGFTLPPDTIGLQAALSTQAFAGAETEGDLLRRIDSAARSADRRGEAALLVIDAIGTDSIARFTPRSAEHLVATLVRIGLDKEARALAAEALLFGPPAQPASVPAAAPPTAAP